MIDEVSITNAQIMNLNLENIDRVAMELRAAVFERRERILRLAELSGVQPDAHLARIIRRVRLSLNALEELLSAVEGMKPVHLEAAE